MDIWIANLADGSTHEEHWVAGEVSPWQRLITYCKKQNTFVRGLRLHMGEQVMQCPDNAIGYWQAHGIPSVQGVKCDEELHTWKGIGWVNEENDVCIIWGARDPKTHQNVWWRDARSAENQMQVIWSPKTTVIPLADLMEVPRAGSPVKNIKKFTDRIVEDAGGLKEIYVPSAHNH